ncbi:MAG: hypothetical protein AVDCRST_MAG26-2500, partial [uncultured Chloroflexia bacterium]
ERQMARACSTVGRLADRAPVGRIGTLRDLAASHLRRGDTRTAPPKHTAVPLNQPAVCLATAGAGGRVVRRTGSGRCPVPVLRHLRPGASAELPCFAFGLLLGGGSWRTTTCYLR